MEHELWINTEVLCQSKGRWVVLLVISEFGNLHMRRKKGYIVLDIAGKKKRFGQRADRSYQANKHAIEPSQNIKCFL